MENKEIETAKSVNDELYEQRIQELKEISKKIKDIIFDYSISESDQERLVFLKNREKELQDFVDAKNGIVRLSFGSK